MARQDDIQFHSERARAELDLARHAASPVAARVHKDLSALHLERMRNLAGQLVPAELS